MPLVKSLGFEYSADDSADMISLRTLAISDAASACDAGWGGCFHDFSTADDLWWI